MTDDEQTNEPATTDNPADSNGSSWAIDPEGRLVDLADQRLVVHPPPPRPMAPRPVLDSGSVYGLRLVVAETDGYVRDMRAASEVWTDEQGNWINVVREGMWYVWHAMSDQRRPPRCPHAVATRAENVYVE